LKCWFADLTAPLPLEAPKPLWSAQVQGRGDLIDSLGPALEKLWSPHNKNVKKIVESPREIDVVGHRVVHGGIQYRQTAWLTPEVRAAIAQQAEFAPAHNRFELEAIAQMDALLGPQARQAAVFDTSFHSTLEPAAYVYPGPYDWLDRGIRRFGFHGISFQYAARRASQMLGREDRRLLLCHLGNGASLAAVRGMTCLDTTMGFTPLDGLMMGSRSGSVDPGILIYLLRHQGCTADDLDRILNRDSGLKGVSGISGDLREIMAAISNDNPRARLAFDVYIHRLCREAGGMIAALGGLDAIVFTGGVGENSAPVREALCRRMAFLGIDLDPGKNARPQLDQDVASPQSRVRLLLIHAEEEWEIARECFALANGGTSDFAGP
jgi:acetate kinase